MSRVFIRFAVPRDAEKFVTDQILTGPPPQGSTWQQRAQMWLNEQQAGRRMVLVAEDNTGLLGSVQIVFRFPEGYNDPEAANGMDIAMMEMLRIRPGASAEVSEKLVEELQNIAMKRNIKTITFCLPMNSAKALAQAKAWGFEEFRIMPETKGMLAFFRKHVE